MWHKAVVWLPSWATVFFLRLENPSGLITRRIISVGKIGDMKPNFFVIINNGLLATSVAAIFTVINARLTGPLVTVAMCALCASIPLLLIQTTINGFRDMGLKVKDSGYVRILSSLG